MLHRLRLTNLFQNIKKDIFNIDNNIGFNCNYVWDLVYYIVFIDCYNYVWDNIWVIVEKQLNFDSQIIHKIEEILNVK